MRLADSGGWSHNDQQCRWELRTGGGAVLAWITDEMIEGTDQAQLAVSIQARIGSVPPPLEQALTNHVRGGCPCSLSAWRPA